MAADGGATINQHQALCATLTNIAWQISVARGATSITVPHG